MAEHSAPKYSVEFSPRSCSWVVHISGSDVLSSTDFFSHTMLASGLSLERIVFRIPNLNDETNNAALLEELNCFSVKHGKACSGGSEQNYNDELAALETLKGLTHVSIASSKQPYSKIGIKLVVAGGESAPIKNWLKAIREDAAERAQIAEKQFFLIRDLEAAHLSKSVKNTTKSNSEVLPELITRNAHFSKSVKNAIKSNSEVLPELNTRNAHSKSVKNAIKSNSEVLPELNTRNAIKKRRIK